MRNFVLELSIHWPHDRFMIGWEYIGPTEEQDVNSYLVYITIFTFSLHLRND